ncbi:MAG TPA: dockerin type I domain-containing protein [Candidatus Udaeobacter sp.]|jgi:hypothetical protein|nr:dockerin type I domain-containing protein [Candidatus Udaeobacter sp.]
MKTIRPFLLALAAVLATYASVPAQTVVNSTWLGDGSTNFKNGDWNDSTLWSPANVPGTDPGFLWDVTIPYQAVPNAAGFNGPNLNVDVTVRNLTLVNRAYVDAQPTSHNLTVTGTTSFTVEPGHDGEYGVLWCFGSTYTLGTLANYNAATHTFENGWIASFAEGFAGGQGGTVQWHNADVVTNNGILQLAGPTSQMLNQDNGNDALEHLSTNNGELLFTDGASFTTAGNFTNNFVVGIGGQGTTIFTVTGSLTNYDPGSHTLSGGQWSIDVSGDDTATATLRFPNADIRTLSNAIITLRGAGASIQDSLTGLNGLRNLQGIQGGNLTSGGTLTITPNGGTFTNDGGVHTIDDGAHVTIDGNLSVINGGTLTINAPTDNNSTILTVNGSTLMAGTNQDMGGQPGVTTIHATEAHFINGIEYRGAALTGTGTVYADILFTQNAHLQPGHSPGQLTFVGNVNLDNSTTTEIQIGGTSPGDQFDQINQSGGLFTLGGTLDLSVIDGAENSITSSDTFDIITSSQMLAGNFDNVISGERLYTSDGIGSFIVTYTEQDKVTLSDFALVQRLTGAVSRRNHGGVDYDIPLALSGNPTVECRNTGGNYTLIFTLVNDIVSGNVDLATQGSGDLAGPPVFKGNTIQVDLTGVTNQQTITVYLTNVTDNFDQVLPDTAVSMSILIGDTSGNGIVNASDVSQTKAAVGQPVSNANFRRDVTVNGVINASDVSLVKSKSGNGLPSTSRVLNGPTKTHAK